MIPLPVLPTVDGIGFDVLFGDEKEADRWMEQKKEREERLKPTRGFYRGGCAPLNPTQWQP